MAGLRQTSVRWNTAPDAIWKLEAALKWRSRNEGRYTAVHVIQADRDADHATQRCSSR
jgi:hypothetical protein